MSDYPKHVRVCDVVNSIFGPGLFRRIGGQALYDQVYMLDGGRAAYLVRIEKDLHIVKQYIPFDSAVVQMYEVK